MHHRTRRQLLTWVAVAAALGLVFASYLNPHWQLDLAQRIWACF